MYLQLLNESKEVTVTQGMCDVSESTESMTAMRAVKLANAFNKGEFHPDVYITFSLDGKELGQVTDDNTIIGFVPV